MQLAPESHARCNICGDVTVRQQRGLHEASPESLPRKRRGSSVVCRDGGNEDKSTRWRCQLGGSGDGDVVRRRMHFLCIESRAMTRAVVGKAGYNRRRRVLSVYASNSL